MIVFQILNTMPSQWRSQEFLVYASPKLNIGLSLIFDHDSNTQTTTTTLAGGVSTASIFLQKSHVTLE